jgi:hypothetical protein
VQGAAANPFFWIALLIAGWAAVSLLRWLGSGGRLPLRGRRGSASLFGGAGLAAQTFYQSGAAQIAELHERAVLQRDDEDEGDRPRAGPTAGGRDRCP